MRTNYMDGLDYHWDLVTETPYSHKFKAIVDEEKGLSVQFDIHYTKSRLANATVLFIGKESEFTDGLFHWILFDLEKIVKRHGRYRGILLSTAYINRTIEGDWLIAK